MVRQEIVNGVLLDEHMFLSLNEFCRVCTHQSEWIIEMVEYGILEPQGSTPDDWRFPAASLDRARRAMRLHQDLQINMAGIALALQLMDELNNLRTQVNISVYDV